MWSLPDAQGKAEAEDPEHGGEPEHDHDNAAAKDLAEIMKEIDQNGDGEIDFQEFMTMMRGAGGAGVEA